MNSISVFLNRFNAKTSSSLQKSLVGMCAVTAIAALVFASRKALTRHPLTPNGERVIVNRVEGPIAAAPPTAAPPTAASPTATNPEETAPKATTPERADSVTDPERAPEGTDSAEAPPAAAPRAATNPEETAPKATTPEGTDSATDPDRAPEGTDSAAAPPAAAPATEIDRLIASKSPQDTMTTVIEQLIPSCTSIEDILNLYYQVLNKQEYFVNHNTLRIAKYNSMIGTIENQLETLIQRFEERIRKSKNNINDKNNQRIAVVNLMKELDWINRPELQQHPDTKRVVQRLDSIRNDLMTSLIELIEVSTNHTAINGLIKNKSTPQIVMQTVINDLIPGCTSLKQILDLSYEVLIHWKYFFTDVQSVHDGLTPEEHSTMLEQLEVRFERIAQSFEERVNSFEERVNSVANHPDDKNHQRNTLLAFIKELDYLDPYELNEYPQIKETVEQLKNKRKQMMIQLINLEEEINRGRVENEETAHTSVLNEEKNSLNRDILKHTEENERRILGKDEIRSLSRLQIQESWESQLRRIRELESRHSFDLANEMKDSLRKELNPRELSRINYLDRTLELRQVRREILRALT
jgi:hypothetical protein